jgi:8-oxo-dGTP diphosphatase
MLRVVAGVIGRNGLILIGQRPPGKSHPLEWEFPGGKIEAGESPREALARELREELNIEARIGREIERYLYGYEGKRPLELIFFQVDEFTGEPLNRAFHEIRWVRQEELSTYPFLEGDRRFIETLAR